MQQKWHIIKPTSARPHDITSKANPFVYHLRYLSFRNNFISSPGDPSTPHCQTGGPVSILQETEFWEGEGDTTHCRGSPIFVGSCSSLLCGNGMEQCCTMAEWKNVVVQYQCLDQTGVLVRRGEVQVINQLNSPPAHRSGDLTVRSFIRSSINRHDLSQ